jgi:DEAD/DEAH box helicase domain-containing protein
VSALPDDSPQLIHQRTLPARTAQFGTWPHWLSPQLQAAWQERGIPQPWTHQQQVAELAQDGKSVIVATGTASGKSLGYLMPSLNAIEEARGPQGQRGATTLYVAPTKALAHDQCKSIKELGLPSLRVTTHDGDSSKEERIWARDFGEYVLTNPDMLHHSMLPRHHQWAKFFGALRFVVLDECHHFRGVFGAHVALILRRLRRVAASYGADPTFILASATIADPEAAGERLIGRPVTAVTEDGSPRGRMTIGLWEPPFTEKFGENDAPTRRSATFEAADLLTDLVVSGTRSLLFVRSRRGVESAARHVREQLQEVDPELVGAVAAYRGGFLPEERRELETSLRSGRLLGLATTNALELGIDVHGLDAVILAGFPGSRAAMWQQFGRAGRRGKDALAVLVARDDPLDTYLVNHPEVLLGSPVETNVFDPSNPHILAPHLCAAAAELPITAADFPVLGPRTEETLEVLTEARLLRRRPRGWFWTDTRRASDLADIRSSGGKPVQLVEQGSGAVLGTIDAASAPAMVHPGATYLHQGRGFVVDELDLDDAVAFLHREEPSYFTTARDISDIKILAATQTREWGPATLHFGDVEVSSQVVSYLKRKHGSGEVLAEIQLDQPAQTLETTAVWWTLPDDVVAASGLTSADLPGAAHAAEHASIGLLPLFATCSRWDIGGVSTAVHADTGLMTIFVHDGHPGGAGFAERGYEAAETWLSATREAIASCTCADGCPSCVQSPKCGNQNNPLDKAGALTLLGLLPLDRPELWPRHGG